jgi:ATP adenylyltransferase
MAGKTSKRNGKAQTGRGLTKVQAPWRYKYFDAPKDPECFLCRAIASAPRDDAKNLVLVRGERAILMLNRYPYTMGALMTVPVAHVGDLRALDAETLLEMNRLVQRAMNILDGTVHPTGYNVGINQGKDAGAGLQDHLHIHIVPRWRADTNFMTTVGEARVLAEDVDAMYERLKGTMENGA